MTEKPDTDTSNDEGSMENATVIFYMNGANGEFEFARTYCHGDVAEMQNNEHATRREIIYHG